MHKSALMWFRRDLRLADNAALLDGVECAHGLACVFVSSDGRDDHAPGAAYLAREQRSLAELATSLARIGGTLTVLGGPAERALAHAAAECGATAVTCSRDWTPAGLAEERAVAAALATVGVEFRVSEGQLIASPGAILTRSGTPFRVFTPFWRTWLGAVGQQEPLPAPRRLNPPRIQPAGRTAIPPHSVPLSAEGPPAVGEESAHDRLEEFTSTMLPDYSSTHDLPAVRGTSELSEPLACGELSPRQAMWRAVEAAGEAVATPFLRQLAWREFSYHVLAANPDMLDEPLRREFSAMPWRDDPGSMDAWASGQTGWPLVDAGMRQLAQTGWMHNRVRMVAASALTKDLLIPWQQGAATFERILADYDPAANAFNWQWISGSGADAAPYFRIFNPTLQGERFDPDGIYVRRWVPELAEMPSRYVHHPWDAPASVLAKAGVRLGRDYPDRLIDHAEARLRALAAFSAVRRER